MEISNKFFCLLGFDVVVVGYGYLGDGNVYLNVLVCEYKDEVWVFILVDFCCVWFILFVERSCLMYILWLCLIIKLFVDLWFEFVI